MCRHAGGHEIADARCYTIVIDNTYRSAPIPSSHDMSYEFSIRQREKDDPR